MAAGKVPADDQGGEAPDYQIIVRRSSDQAFIGIYGSEDEAAAREDAVRIRVGSEGEVYQQANTVTYWIGHPSDEARQLVDTCLT